ncbi:hypothetical protein ABBQ38_010966 [Trebouxia sp. C0009 RCD-2024]
MDQSLMHMQQQQLRSPGFRPFCARQGFPGHFRRSFTCCEARATETQTPSKDQMQKRDRLTRSQEVPDLPAPRSPFNTGSMDITTAGATASLCGHDLPSEKTIIIVRHGLTTWNEQSRIQGTADDSDITPYGQEQAIRARNALSRMNIDSLFSSPLKRARTTSEIMWQGREGPLNYIESLKEAPLGWLQGMTNADAEKKDPEQFEVWRKDPAKFSFDGRYPLLEVYDKAKEAWTEILEAPGSSHLIITHKSMARAFLCTALALPPTSFRSLDMNNGGVSIFRVNKRGEPMLTNMNMVSHEHYDGVYY